MSEDDKVLATYDLAHGHLYRFGRKGDIDIEAELASRIPRRRDRMIDHNVKRPCRAAARPHRTI